MSTRTYRGNPIISVRIPPDLLAELDAAVAHAIRFRVVPNESGTGRNAEIIAAIQEHLVALKAQEEHCNRQPLLEAYDKDSHGHGRLSCEEARCPQAESVIHSPQARPERTGGLRAARRPQRR